MTLSATTSGAPLINTFCSVTLGSTHHTFAALKNPQLEGYCAFAPCAPLRVARTLGGWRSATAYYCYRSTPFHFSRLSPTPAPHGPRCWCRLFGPCSILSL